MGWIVSSAPPQLTRGSPNTQRHCMWKRHVKRRLKSNEATRLGPGLQDCGLLRGAETPSPPHPLWGTGSSSRLQTKREAALTRAESAASLILDVQPPPLGGNRCGCASRPVCVVFCYGSPSRPRQKRDPTVFLFFFSHGTKAWLSGEEGRLRGESSFALTPPHCPLLPGLYPHPFRGAGAEQQAMLQLRLCWDGRLGGPLDNLRMPSRKFKPPLSTRAGRCPDRPL